MSMSLAAGRPIAQAEPDAAELAARERRFPVGAEIVFADLDDHARTPALDRLRSAEPVSWLPALGGWLVTAYEPAQQALDPRAPFTVYAEPNLVRASLGLMMLTSDGDEHGRQRRPFDGPFHRRAVEERFADPIADRARSLLDGLVPAGSCELAADFAALFAIGVAGDMLGLPLQEVGRIREFYDAFAGAMTYDGDPEPQRRADAARAELSATLLGQLQLRREQADGSVTAAVAADAASGLTDDEIVAQLRVILFGAIETVESMILNSVLQLLEHPPALAALLADAGLIANALEESMRLIPPVAFIERWTAGPVSLGGVDLGAGEFVGISTVAANRDPAVFPDPASFNIDRRNARHSLVFSSGVHHCLGFHMARLQGRIAVSQLLRRLPGIELVEAAPTAGFAFRKPARLVVRWKR
jgi:cytochrome P450